MTFNKETYEKAITDMSLGDSLEAFEYVLQLYRLTNYWERYKFVTENNVRADGYTYHNDIHTKLVVLNAAEGCEHNHLDNQQCRIVLLAAMFHDAGHYSRNYRDSFNVVASGNKFRQAQAFAFADKIHNDDVDAVVKIINATEFPRSRKLTSLDIQSHIVMDADVMTVYCKDRATRLQLFLGLKNEIVPYLPMDDFVEMQKKFSLMVNNGVTNGWITRWARIKSVKKNWAGQFRELYQDLYSYDEIRTNA